MIKIIIIIIIKEKMILFQTILRLLAKTILHYLYLKKNLLLTLNQNLLNKKKSKKNQFQYPDQDQNLNLIESKRMTIIIININNQSLNLMIDNLKQEIIITMTRKRKIGYLYDI
jgi:hypothetical protein